MTDQQFEALKELVGNAKDARHTLQEMQLEDRETFDAIMNGDPDEQIDAAEIFGGLDELIAYGEKLLKAEDR